MKVTTPETEEEGPPRTYYNYQYMLDNYPDITTCVDYRPFTLKITKAGYQDYQEVIDPTQDDWYPEGINRVVAMIPYSPNIGESFDVTINSDNIKGEIS